MPSFVLALLLSIYWDEGMVSSYALLPTPSSKQRQSSAAVCFVARPHRENQSSTITENSAQQLRGKGK
jgi:hypothetical protein